MTSALDIETCSERLKAATHEVGFQAEAIVERQGDYGLTLRRKRTSFDNKDLSDAPCELRVRLEAAERGTIIACTCDQLFSSRKGSSVGLAITAVMFAVLGLLVSPWLGSEWSFWACYFALVAFFAGRAWLLARGEARRSIGDERYLLNVTRTALDAEPVT
ncbi:MAG TPA: hypothetical protein VGI95_19905 [Caulobacteraceae bacterium]|jgi:hypothetical protein